MYRPASRRTAGPAVGGPGHRGTDDLCDQNAQCQNGEDDGQPTQNAEFDPKGHDPHRSGRIAGRGARKAPGQPISVPISCDGNMYHPNFIGRIHKKLLKQAGLPDIRFHDLRHTFATLALQNGVDVKTLSSMLGHYSAGFTLDTYTHATMKMQIEAADKLGGFIAQTV